MRSTNRSWLIGIILIVGSVVVSCESEDPLSIDRNARVRAQGFWQAPSEDILALHQEGISALSWFAIDALSSPDSISVTWPDPLGCTPSRGEFGSENELTFSTDDAEVSFSFLNENKASATYFQGGQTATLLYEKTTTDATVICF